MADDTPDLDGTSHEDLKELVQLLRQEVAELKRENAALRDQNARLKGKPPRPNIKPGSGDDKQAGSGEKTAKGSAKTKTKKRGRGSKRSRLTIDEDRHLRPDGVPDNARFKGYEDYVVQDLEVRPRNIRYRRERWELPDGTTVTADLPANTRGHYGGELRRLVLSLYHRGQMTVPRLTQQLIDLGVLIDQRQVQRLLADPGGVFVPESGEVLHAGIASAAWLSVDDTGARHRGQNGYCTQIGDSRFTGFATTDAKSRLDFLEILRAGHTDYVINVEALAYMAKHNLAQQAIERLAESPTHFPDEASWLAHLSALGLDRQDRHARIATEGALYGALTHHGLLEETVVLSDDAGQFRVGNHALCWIHAERLIKGLDAFTARERAAVKKLRRLIWKFYNALKGYAEAPSAKQRKVLRNRFDRIFRRKTGFAPLDQLLQRLYRRKEELLTVLDRPEVPLHTNGSENDIRCHVTRRKVSGGTWSDHGRDCRDAHLGLMKTCDKLGISYWRYLGSRLGLPDVDAVPPLADLIRARAPT